MVDINVHHGDCIDVMRLLVDEDVTVDAICTDPPYHLGKTGFMNKTWDAVSYGIAFDPDTWRLAYDLLKPGGHLIAFGGTRTYHRLACAIEDAGFEIRDCIRSLNGQVHYPAWAFGSGFPKAEQWTQDKADKGNAESAMMVEAGFEGWARGGLKPAWEPICLARKPMSEPTIAANVLKHGTGGLNIDACRVASGENTARPQGKDIRGGNYGGGGLDKRSELITGGSALGRFPSNLIHDGSAEVMAAFSQFGEKKTGSIKSGTYTGGQTDSVSRGKFKGYEVSEHKGDSGSAARFFPSLGCEDDELTRFFYCSKASRREKHGTSHPTTKPVKLISWLARLVTPPGGTVLDCFAGSGTTGIACLREGFNSILIERELEYYEMIKTRLRMEKSGRFNEAGQQVRPGDAGDLFSELVQE